MRYHETVPSEAGIYVNPVKWPVLLLLRDSEWSANERMVDPESFTPLIGPLPTTSDEAIALACEVQFARMWAKWVKATVANDSVTVNALSPSFATWSA